MAPVFNCALIDRSNPQPFGHLFILLSHSISSVPLIFLNVKTSVPKYFHLEGYDWYTNAGDFPFQVILFLLISHDISLEPVIHRGGDAPMFLRLVGVSSTIAPPYVCTCARATDTTTSHSIRARELVLCSHSSKCTSPSDH